MQKYVTWENTLGKKRSLGREWIAMQIIKNIQELLIKWIKMVFIFELYDTVFK